jgi:hypothetical protein
VKYRDIPLTPAVILGGAAAAPDVVVTNSPRGLVARPDQAAAKAAVTVSFSGPKVSATFAPASGALSLEDAANILDVNHFNWVQEIEKGPGRPLAAEAAPGPG